MYPDTQSGFEFSHSMGHGQLGLQQQHLLVLVYAQ